jgi:spermidine synthase
MELDLESLAAATAGTVAAFSDGARARADAFIAHEALAHVAAVSHPRPVRVAVFGGADGGVVAELLKHRPIERIDWQIARGGERAVPPALRLRSNARVRIDAAIGADAPDVPPRCWDLIIADACESAREHGSALDAQVIGLAARHLHRGGIFAAPLGSPIAAPRRVRDALRALEASFEIIVPYMVPIGYASGPAVFVCAAHEIDPRLIARNEIHQRLRTRRLPHLRYYSTSIHRAGFALPPYVVRLLRGEGAEAVAAISSAPGPLFAAGRLEASGA